MRTLRKPWLRPRKNPDSFKNAATSAKERVLPPAKKVVVIILEVVITIEVDVAVAVEVVAAAIITFNATILVVITRTHSKGENNRLKNRQPIEIKIDHAVVCHECIVHNIFT